MAVPAVAAGGAAAAGGAGGKAAAAGGKAGGAGGAQRFGGQPSLPRSQPGFGSDQDEDEDDGGGPWIAIAFGGGLVGLLMLFMLLVVPLMLVAGVVGSRTPTDPGCSGNECAPAGDLPEGAVPFLAMYADAARAYHVNRYLLMAVHEDESDYGRSSAQGVLSGVNSAGCCAGPLQFSIAGGATPAAGGSGGTWAAYRDAYRNVATLHRPAAYPNRSETHPNVYDSYDAIYAAAKYLHAKGAGPRLDAGTLDALRRYKGTPPYSEPFAQHDYARAKELERLAQQGFPGPLPDGPRGTIDARSGDATPPADAPPAIVGIYRAANEIHTKRYVMVHYPTHLENPTYDCSSATSHALWGGGLFGTVPWVATQFTHYGEPGVDPKGWLTIWAKPGSGGNGHVFLVVAGLRFDTARWTKDHAVPPGSGPRWSYSLQPLATARAEGFRPRHVEGL